MTKMTGIDLVPSFSESSGILKPSMPGIMISSNIKSGDSDQRDPTRSGHYLRKGPGALPILVCLRSRIFTGSSSTTRIVRSVGGRSVILFCGKAETRLSHQLFWSLNALRVFCISMATVIGPTPPGIMILEALGTIRRFTSPTSL